MDTSILKEAGLTDGEIKVYLALLELGSATTGPIVKKSGVSRSIVYHLLERLMEKGLASTIIRQKTTYFQAAEPNKILEYIDERAQKLKASKDKVEGMLPQLLLLKEMAPETEVQVYLGFKGVQTACEHLYIRLKRGEYFYCLGVPTFQEEKYHLYWQRDHQRRVKTGIKCQLLFNEGTDPSILRNRNSYAGCDARYMSTAIKTPAWIQVYKDTTTIVLQSKGGIAIEVVNQEIADSFRSYFNEFWKLSKPFNS